MPMSVSPLRKCRECGLEAHNKEELNLFCKSSYARGKHGRRTICKNCHSKKYNTKEKSEKRFWFKDKTIIPENNPRTNTCSECKKSYPKDLSTQTHIHHTEYDEENPLKNTVELCNSCHLKLHWRMGTYK